MDLVLRSARNSLKHIAAGFGSNLNRRKERCFPSQSPSGSILQTRVTFSLWNMHQVK